MTTAACASRGRAYSRRRMRHLFFDVPVKESEWALKMLAEPAPRSPGSAAQTLVCRRRVQPWRLSKVERRCHPYMADHGIGLRFATNSPGLYAPAMRAPGPVERRGYTASSDPCTALCSAVCTALCTVLHPSGPVSMMSSRSSCPCTLSPWRLS